MVFVYTPLAVPATTMTGTEIVQVPGAAGVPAGILPPERVTLACVVETVPGGTLQSLVAVPLTFNSGGKLSVTFTPVKSVLFGFCRVMINVVVPPTPMVGGENRFERPTSRTVKRAVASVEFVRPCCVWRALAGIRFVYAPCTVEVTVTVTVQVAPEAILPLFRVTVVPPLAAVTEAEPPHPLNVGEGGVARKTLAGRLSVMEA
jgi:hypothetical protein